MSGPAVKPVVTVTDNDILAAVEAIGGGFSFRIAHNLGLRLSAPTTRKLYQRLRRLEDARRIHRCPRLSAINAVFWLPGPSA